MNKKFPFRFNLLGFLSSRLPSFLYIVLLVLLYIANTFDAQSIHREILSAKRSISDLTVRAATTRAAYITTTKESNIVDMINKRNIGLKEISTPPLTF